MNNRDFISELAKRTGHTAKDALSIMNTLTEEMTARWMDNDSITVMNFGSFEVKKKTERVSVSPTTGQRMLIPPKLVLTFRPSPQMKERIQKDYE